MEEQKTIDLHNKQNEQGSSREDAPKKFLFIDDSEAWLSAMRRAFFNNPGVKFAECHSVDEAINAINTHKPDVVFLDHNLSEYGDDGLTIVDRIAGTGVHICSTTSDSFVAEEYKKRGIEHISKRDFQGFQLIISEKGGSKNI